MRKTGLAALAAVIMCGSANAAVTYSFAYSAASPTFILILDNYVTSDTTYTTFALKTGNIDSALLSPDCAGAGGACDSIVLGNSIDRSSSYYFFPDGALGSNGVYPTSFGFFRAILTVSGTPTSSAAPEPASWAMMIAGFGAIGMAMRRRKVAVSFA